MFCPECPDEGTGEAVTDTSAWADKCFSAVNGRMPTYPAESSTLLRDLDLDGTPERLEARGTGNASKTIYVFRQSAGGNVYLGSFDASLTFEVSRAGPG